MLEDFCRRVGISLAKGRYSGDSAMRAEIEMPKNLHSFIAIRGKWPILQASKIASVFVYAPRRTVRFPLNVDQAGRISHRRTQRLKGYRYEYWHRKVV
jgi:hypothetical protein